MTLPTDAPRNEAGRDAESAFAPVPLDRRTPGEHLDQGSSSGRHVAQDPLNGPSNDDSHLPQQPVAAGVDAFDDDFNADDFEYVRIDGVVRAIPKASVQDEPETATQTIPKAAMAEVPDPHFYVWLANGEVVRVKQSDLPPTAGTNAAYGFWQREDKVFQIVNVYPVEDTVKGENA